VRSNAQSFIPEAELRITDSTGRQDPSFQINGYLLFNNSMIVIGSASKVGFPYRLTNNVLALEMPIRRNEQGLFSGFKIKLKKVEGEHD